MIALGIISYSPASSYDSDAQAFFDASGISDSTQKSAVNQLVLDLKAYSIWSKMLGLYPLVGGSASTHKWNLKDPRDLDAAYRLVFGGSWTHSSTGITGNGSTSYADTLCDLAAATTINSLCLGVYSRTNSSSTQKSWGVYYLGYDSSTGVMHPGIQTHMYINISGVKFLIDMGDLGGSSNRVMASNSDTSGMMVANRNSSSYVAAYRNGSRLAYKSNASGGGLKSGSTLYFGANHKLNDNSAESPDNREYAFAFMSTGLSDTEVANLYTAVQAFQTTLGRNV